MQFSNPTDKSGLCEDCDFMVSSDPVVYSLEDKAVKANAALDRAFGYIIGADGRWQFDDSNFTTLPIATTALVANQQDYTFDPRFLVITRVECQDQLGNWRKLIPIDQNDIPSVGIYNDNMQNPALPVNTSLTDYLKVPGNPIYYDKIDGSLFLYPRSNYSQAASLKVYYQRKIDYFTSTDTTKEPGFASHLHRYISISMAYDYALSHSLNTIGTIKI